MKDHTKNRMTHVEMRKPTRDEWMKYAGRNSEPTFTTSDKFMFSGFAISLTVLAGYYFEIMPEWVAWLGIGMCFGCIFVAVFDALRREFGGW